MEILSKSCLTKSKITEYVINPYVGCQHGCVYCYADFIKKFRKINKEWGKFIFVKKNCLEILEKELEKNPPGHIWMSSVTDCYTPIERNYKITRKILEILLNFKDKFTLEILTKSSLVERDFDLIKKLNAELGMSVNTLDEKYTNILEPGASKPRERIETLKKAKAKGIKVYGFISPVLPGITDLEKLFRELSFCDYVWVELLNTKKSVLTKLIPVIKKEFPDKISDFNFMINFLKEHFQKIKEEVYSLGKKYKLEVKGIVVHNEKS